MTNLASIRPKADDASRVVGATADDFRFWLDRYREATRRIPIAEAFGERKPGRCNHALERAIQDQDEAFEALNALVAAMVGPPSLSRPAAVSVDGTLVVARLDSDGDPAEPVVIEPDQIVSLS